MTRNKFLATLFVAPFVAAFAPVVQGKKIGLISDKEAMREPMYILDGGGAHLVIKNNCITLDRPWRVVNAKSVAITDNVINF